MIEKVTSFLSEKKLIAVHDVVLVALSGGADSVALLRVLLQGGFHCVAAHCNFHLRGEESDRDEAFVRELCRQHDVPLHVVHFSTRAYAAEHKISIEMAARDLRYAWFEQLRVEVGAACIAVAHHQDDSVETFLLNLIRGSGLQGLQGIRVRNGRVVRPLLGVSRAEILSYLESIGQPYVTDSTNLQDEFMRNKIRLNILPLMEEVNPAVREHIASACGILQQVDGVYRDAMERAKADVFDGEAIGIAALLQHPEPEMLLYHILAPEGFNAVQVHSIFQAVHSQPGKEFVSRSGCRVVKDRDSFLLQPAGMANPAPHFTLQREEFDYTPQFVIPRSRDKACVDTDKLDGPLQLRLWQKGDWFVPFGMKGRKLVSDYLTDRKCSLLQKENQWVLACGDRIVWLVGERADNRFRVDEHTCRVTVFTICR